MFSYVQQMPENHDDFHRLQQLLEQQLMSQNGIIINPNAAKILKLVLDEEFGGIDNFLKGDFIHNLSGGYPNRDEFKLFIERTNPEEDISAQQLIGYFEEIVDRKLQRTNEKFDEENRASLIQALFTLAGNNDLIPGIAAGVYIPRETEEITMVAEAISTTFFPPEIQIENVSPQEFLTIQKELSKDLLYDFGSDDLLITDRLQLSAISVGNTRIIDLEDFSNLCITSFGEKYREASNNEWLQLRRSTCPYSVLSDSERELIQDNIKEIVAYAASAGLVIVVVYLVIEVEEIKRKKSQSINAMGDVVLENGYLDKRKGIFLYVTTSDEKDQGVKDAYIQFNKPTDKLFKAITILTDPKNENNFFAFPNLLDYVADNKIDIENTEFGDDKLVDCRAASLLPCGGNQVVVGKKLIGLLDDQNEEVRSISADVLGEVKTESVIRGLGEHLKKEKSEKVINNILSSLLSIGSEVTLQYVFNYVASYNISELLTNWCVQKANTQSLLVLFRAATEYPVSESAQKILTTIKSHNIDLDQILNEFISNEVDKVKLNIATFFTVLLEKSFDKNTHAKVSLALAKSMIEDERVVAVGISKILQDVKNLDSGDVEVLLKSLDSPHEEVRMNLVARIGGYLNK